MKPVVFGGLVGFDRMGEPRAWWSDADVDHPHDPGHWQYVPDAWIDEQQRLDGVCVDPTTIVEMRCPFCGETNPAGDELCARCLDLANMDGS